MKFLFALLIFIAPILLQAQNVAINNDGSDPDHNAILDVNSSSKGILLPRMTTAQRTGILGPAIGLTVFDINTFSYWMYRGDVWGGWAELTHQYQNHWNLNGINVHSTNPGNIGIGTNMPVSKLTINGTNPGITFMNEQISKGYLWLNGDNLYMGTHLGNVNGNLNLGTRDNIRMSITPDAKVGVGIQSPLSKFQITGGAEATLDSHGFVMLGSVNSTNMVIDNNEIQVRSNGVASHLRLQEDGGNVYIGDVAAFNSSHKLGVNGHTVITGNLRIGNIPNPNGYKLAVEGKVICTEVMVRLAENWPDYVFDESYNLRKLDDVERFIKTHHHLPGVPSAKDIVDEGLNLGEIQRIQMEKIEELTLYIIELKKEIELLKKSK